MLGEMTDNCACNVYKLGGALVASTETCLLRRIDPDTLETGEKIDISGLVNIASARALTDPVTGDVFNISGTFLTGLKYHFIKFPDSSEVQGQKDLLASAKTVASFPSRMTTCFSYYHSFGMTDGYLIMIEQPWVANSIKLATSKMKGQTFYECLDWCQNEKNLFHVIDKESGKVVKQFISSSGFFFLNFINCYEENNDILVDLVGYDSPEMLEKMSLEKLRQGRFDVKDKSKVMRFKLSLDAGEKQPVIEPKLVTPDQGCEHPSINRKFTGKKYQYAYVIGWLESVNRGPFANALTKINMDNGQQIAWRGDEFCHPAEALFVPKSEDSAEDEGLVIASVTDVREDQKDFLVFLDARTMAELARANFDDSIPFASHAYFHEDQ